MIFLDAFVQRVRRLLSPPPAPPVQLTVEACDFECDRDDEDHELRIYATFGDERVGQISCSIQGDRLKVSDFEVHEDSNWREVLSRQASGFGAGEPLAPPRWLGRRSGIGSKLLDLAIERAEAAGLAEVWGCVTRDYDAKRPWLVGFYERRGFTSSPPDADCAMYIAKTKVTRRLRAR